MADTSPPLGAGGLSHFDLPTIFHCGIELAEAASNLTEQEWADLPANCEGPTSPIFERQMEASRRLRRIEDETDRLKRSLGATGPLGFRGGETDGGPRWESYDQRFNNTDHDRVIRLSLCKLATAAIDLSGFATWREWQWYMRETGLRLLSWGLAQLWEGMSETERSKVRDRLPRTHKAIGWPVNPASDPPAYAGPDEIPLPDQYRIVANYISCHRDYLDDIQRADNQRVEQGQEKFLRWATLVQFVETAERAEQALQAMAKRRFDTPAEWGDLYRKAVWPLACLRRAHEVQPREAWPAHALEQRKSLADAAGILLTWVGGTAEAKAGLKPADADKAFKNFTQAMLRLRAIVDPTKYPSEGSAYSLGMLIDALQNSESAFVANSRTADRVEAEEGSIAAQWWRVQAAALKFQPDSAKMPGIDLIQLLCDELDNPDGLTAANVAKIRAKVCRAKPCNLEVANALSLHEAADVIEGKDSCAGDTLIERLLAGPDDAELSPREMALLEAHLRQPVSFATIQQEKKATGHSPTEAARNKLKLIRDFNRALQGQGDADEAEKKSDPVPAVAQAAEAAQAEATPAAAQGDNASLALMRVFTNGIVEDRIAKATRLLTDGTLTVNEKLSKIDTLIPFPATASAEQLGEMFGVTKQAVLKTPWWIQNRKGEKDSEIGRRRESHRKRAKSYEAPDKDDDE